MSSICFSAAAILENIDLYHTEKDAIKLTVTSCHVMLSSFSLSVINSCIKRSQGL